MYDLKSKLQAMRPQSGEPAPADAASTPKTPVDINPTTQSGDTFFLSPDLLPEGYKCKVGDELMLRVSVKSKGSKIGLTPIEVVEDNSAMDGGGEAEADDR